MASMCDNLPDGPALWQCKDDERQAALGIKPPPTNSNSNTNTNSGGFWGWLGGFLGSNLNKDTICALGGKGENCKNAPVVNNNYYPNGEGGGSGGNNAPKTDNTLMYVLIGVAGLLGLGSLIFVLVKQQKTKA